jgi:2',3'-cyclic-nucleotide 2'-phosphodiesterase (5'-nucleotidase family)
MNIVIGQSEAELVKGKPSSTLTNFFADAFAEGSKHVTKTDIDFAISNYGGIRVNALAKGDITIGKVYELMPFDNLLAIAIADSAGIHMLCDRIARYGGWPVSKELNFIIEDSVASNITVKGYPLSSAKKYEFALPDYVANGGDDCYFLKNYSIKFTQYMIRDILIEEIKRRKFVLEDSSARIKIGKNGR